MPGKNKEESLPIKPGVYDNVMVEAMIEYLPIDDVSAWLPHPAAVHRIVTDLSIPLKSKLEILTDPEHKVERAIIENPWVHLCSLQIPYEIRFLFAIKYAQALGFEPTMSMLEDHLKSLPWQSRNIPLHQLILNRCFNMSGQGASVAADETAIEKDDTEKDLERIAQKVNKEMLIDYYEAIAAIKTTPSYKLFKMFDFYQIESKEKKLRFEVLTFLSCYHLFSYYDLVDYLSDPLVADMTIKQLDDHEYSVPIAVVFYLQAKKLNQDDRMQTLFNKIEAALANDRGLHVEFLLNIECFQQLWKNINNAEKERLTEGLLSLSDQGDNIWLKFMVGNISLFPTNVQRIVYQRALGNVSYRHPLIRCHHQSLENIAKSDLEADVFLYIVPILIFQKASGELRTLDDKMNKYLIQLEEQNNPYVDQAQFKPLKVNDFAHVFSEMLKLISKDDRLLTFGRGKYSLDMPLAKQLKEFLLSQMSHPLRVILEEIYEVPLNSDEAITQLLQGILSGQKQPADGEKWLKKSVIPDFQENVEKDNHSSAAVSAPPHK